LLLLLAYLEKQLSLDHRSFWRNREFRLLTATGSAEYVQSGLHRLYPDSHPMGMLFDLNGHRLALLQGVWDSVIR
jgi:hypothetical protein